MADPAECTTGGSGEPRIPAPPLGKEASPEERNRHNEANRVDCVRIVHLLRHSLDFVSFKDRKAVATALKDIYRALDATAAAAALDDF